MGSPCGASEIVESNEEPNLFYHSDETNARCLKLKADDRDGNSCDFHLEGDTNQIDLRTSSKVGGLSRQMGTDIGRKCILKKPVKGGISPSSEIGISESVTLKQALRKLCISQASEMAAMKKISKPIGLSGIPEAETIKKLYASVVVQTNEERRNLVEISFMPEKITNDSSEKAAELCHLQNLESTNKIVVTSHCTVPNKTGVAKTRIQDVITSTDTEDDTPNAKIGTNGKLVSMTSLSNFKTSADSGKSTSSPRLMKPVLRDKACIKKKGKRDPTSAATNGSSKCVEVNKVGAVPTKMKLACKAPASNSTNLSGKFGTRNKDSSGTVTNLTPSSKCGGAVGDKMNGISRSKEKGECSQSSKSSIGDYSCSTSISEESHQSGSSGNCSRPHMSRDVRWIAIQKSVTQHGSLGLDDFKLLKRLGCGDIGTVYLAELIGSECLFALKVMDNEYLASRKKMLRALTEQEILQMLDHPFLPTLYAHFTTDNLSCLVMEYCPGGDLHVLRQKQPCRSFSEPAARFYVAEVLLALEYLHMLGVLYRDLKPENILVREDGHVMLTDFDLSLRYMVNPMLLRSSSLGTTEPSSKKQLGPCAENSCIEPLCLQPSWVNVSCFTPHSVEKTRKVKPDQAGQVSPLPQLVVEPVEARSNSFVGTHEYLAPEIIRGDGHGSAVDWWTFGIFLYELLFGRTPFKGPGNEETLSNVVSQSLKFPDCPEVSFDARDLIRGLLTKEPENRLGSVRGAAEIKQHPFFEGLNWALIRCAAPPETPKNYDVATPTPTSTSTFKKKEKGKCLDFRTNGEHVEFELF